MGEDDEDSDEDFIGSSQTEIEDVPALMRAASPATPASSGKPESARVFAVWMCDRVRRRGCTVDLIIWD